MPKKDKQKADKQLTPWRYLFLVLTVICIIWAACFWIHSVSQTLRFPFFGISIRQADNTTLQTSMMVQGQYKTKGQGFFVGKRASISAIVFFNDKQTYDSFKAMMQVAPGIEVVGTITSEATNRDLTRAIRSADWNEAFINPGTAKMSNSFDDKKTVVLEGDVILMKEGPGPQFGMPLGPILEANGIHLTGPTVEPASTKYQIDLNITITLLAIVTVAIAFLAVFFSLSKRVP